MLLHPNPVMFINNSSILYDKSTLIQQLYNFAINISLMLQSRWEEQGRKYASSMRSLIQSSAIGYFQKPSANPTTTLYERKIQGQERVTVRIACRQRTKSFVVRTCSMIFEPDEQFNSFTAIAFEHRIVDDEDGIPIRGHQRIYLLHGSHAK